MLVPENYGLADPSSGIGGPNSQGSNISGQQNQGVAPFDWLHFEGRSVKTTLSNISGIDGLAKESRWRNRCVFSLDACKTRQGVEAVSVHCSFVIYLVLIELRTAYTPR